MVSVEAVGLDVARNFFRQGAQAFQRGMKKDFRRAANVFASDIRATLKSGSPLKSGTGRHHDKIVQLSKGIRASIKPTATDLVALIGPSRRAFFGRFHETGIDTTTERHNAKSRSVLRAFRRQRSRAALAAAKSHKSSYRLVIPRRPFVEPAYNRRVIEVLGILGDSYQAEFFRGGKS